MPVLIADLSKVTEQVLADLVGIAENETLEFKRDTYGIDDKARRELCKDVSALANTLGGDIVLGIDEVDGVASAIVGLNCADINGEIQRLQNIISMAIEPVVLGVRFHSIPLSNGQPALMIRVPRSLDVPHRVTHSGINRFYLRRTADTFEASLLELRRMFELARNEFDRAQQFHAEQIARIATNRETIPLSGKDDGYYVVHIVPFGFSQRIGSIDLSQLQRDNFRPLGNPMGFSARFSIEGLIVCSGEAPCYGYTTIMRGGAIEATKANVVIANRGMGTRIDAKSIADDIERALAQYIPSLRQVGAPGPWIVLATLERCEGARPMVSKSGWEADARSGLPLRGPTWTLPGVLIDTQSSRTEIHDALRPMLDALWQGAGLEKFA
jgi:Putative DNA-binding domain